MLWGAHAPSRTGDDALAIADFITHRHLLALNRAQSFRQERRNVHARARALSRIQIAILLKFASASR
jgi:hypothetical protein